MTVLPKEPQQNNNSHRHEPQKMTWIRKQDQYSNEECTIALTISKRNVVGMLTVDVQNT
jgi:hypothetical protein